MDINYSKVALKFLIEEDDGMRVVYSLAIINLGKTWSQFIIGTLKVRQHRRKISKSIDTKNEKIETKILVLIRECLLQMNSFVQFQD